MLTSMGIRWAAVSLNGSPSMPPERVGALILGATTGGDERGHARSDAATADLASADPHAAHTDARLVILSGARHGYYLEHANATEVVLAFLAAHSLAH